MQRSRSTSETIGDDTLQKLYDNVLKGYELTPPQDIRNGRPGNPSHSSAVNLSSPPEFLTLPQQNSYRGQSDVAPAPGRPTRTIRPLPPTPRTALGPNGFFPPMISSLPTTNGTLPIPPPPPLTSNSRPLPSHTSLMNSPQPIDTNGASPRYIDETIGNGFPRQSRDRSASPVPEYRPNASDDPNSSGPSQYLQSYANDSYLPNHFIQDPTPASPGNSVINESTYSILRPPSDLFPSSQPFDDSINTPTFTLFPSGINTVMRRDNSISSYQSSRDSAERSQEDSSAAQRRNTSDLYDIINFTPSLPDVSQDNDEDDYVEDETFYVNFSLLSNLAVILRDKVPRGTHVKGSIPYPRAFTGKDIVSTIHSQIQRVVVRDHGGSPDDRRAALLVAQSLQKQLFFYEVEWGTRILQDGLEDVYMFLDDQEGGSDTATEREELPSGVVTALTKCYSTNCVDSPGLGCYSYSCPRRGLQQLPSSDPSTDLTRGDWSQTVPVEVLQTLNSSQINRQTIIQKLISKEEQYVRDLDIVESVFIKPLRKTNPPVIETYQLDEFIGDVFGNILDIRDCNKGLLDVLYVRQREQAPVIQRIGDIFLDAATDFRDPYPIYIGHYPLAEKRLREEMETNPRFRLFIEECSRKQSMRPGEIPRLDLRHLLNRPGEHLQKYPVLLEAILNEKCSRGDPDSDFILEAIGAINNLQNMAQLRTFQSAMGKGVTGRWEWHDLVPPDLRLSFTKEEARRQAVIFELIKGEMAYVKDLENIDNIYIRPLQDQEDEPIIPRKRFEHFINDVFHNFRDLHEHHRRLLDALHEIQREQHPRIRSVAAVMLNATLNFRDAYMEYIPNYPIAAYRIDNEKVTNPEFKSFVERCIRHPESHRLDMKNFINRPIPRLLRYELLLKTMLEESPPGHEDVKAIPQVIDIIKGLGREAEPGVASAKQKVDLWKYNSSIVFKPGETVDMDLLSEQRSLIHTGKLLRPPESGIGNTWTETFVLLFDNYLVMTKSRDKDGVLKYQVNRRPIPLDLLSMMNFNDAPTQRVTGLLRTLRNDRNDRNIDRQSDSASIISNRTNENDSRLVYPFTIHHTGRLGGTHMLYAESAQVRTEWKQKLEESIGLRKVVQESNRVFEVETLSCDTFLVPSMPMGPMSPVWHEGTMFTGKVTCSVPLNTHDGRGLIAIGCAEGVWIGFRHDSRSMRRVLHLRSVTQCAILEDFGIFLVLADKSLFAYHIEALVPSNPHTGSTSQTPQKLNGSKDVHFFSIGTMQGRTLVAYMRRRPAGSEFHVMEPVTDKINEQPRTPSGLLNTFRSLKTEWFRTYREFILPSETYDLVFLKAKVAILTPKGFEIMDLNDLTAVVLPRRDHPQLAPFVKRLDSCKPLGIFGSSETEFLLCYDEFGIFVDKRGGPLRDMCIVEWEGHIERAAFHAPYILLFNPKFIEIRHVETGRLVQIIPGNDLRCVWDGRGFDSTTIPAGSISDENMVQEPRVHAVTGLAELPSNGRPKGTIQHVYELVPTIPLYLPGAISSPPLFAVGFPPARSPGHF